jgi:hypothetical protein
VQGSKYAPSKVSEFSSKDVNASFNGVYSVATKNSTTNIDFLLSDDCLITGAMFSTKGAVYGDKVHFQVVDKDNMFGYGAGMVLNQFITNWFINPDISRQLDMENGYPAKIYAGLYLRLVYVSIGTELDIDIIINYKLHKVLW